MTARIEFHPVANLFPLMSGEEYAKFRSDIQEHGLREPISLLDGRVIDGRNRYNACLETGIPLRTKPYDGEDPLAFVLSANLHRRHLNVGQRAMSAARLVTQADGGASWRVVTEEEAARLLNVAPRSVDRAFEVLRHGSPELIDAVDRGVMRLSAAANIAKQPREKQLARLERDRRKADGTYRHEEDYYRTPPKCTRALLDVEWFGDEVWEPACGDGAISRVLEAPGRRVISSDIVDRGYGEVADFLTATELRAAFIVTNPPYDQADEFALHALSLGVRKMALLCRLAWLEGQDRYERLFSQQKLARVWVFSARQTLWRGDEDGEDDGGMTAYAWFVFERDHSGNATLGWLTPEEVAC